MCFTGKLPGAELMDWVYNALNALGEVNTLATRCWVWAHRANPARRAS